MRRVLLAMCALSGTWGFAAEKAAPVTYDQVRPVLKKHCVTYHNTERPRGDLDLSNLGAILTGSASGPVAVKGKPEESSLFTMPAHLEEPFMPPNSPKIPQRELDLLQRWIADGLLEKGGTTPPSASTNDAGLVEAKRTAALADAAVKSAEEALMRAKATAQALRVIVREKEAAARKP